MKTFFSIALVCMSHALFAQCNSGELEVTITVFTDNWGYEAYWELVPTGNGCGNGTLQSGGNTNVGCGGGTGSPGEGYANDGSFVQTAICLTEGASFDLIGMDSYGDGGLTFNVNIGGYDMYQHNTSGAADTYTFVVELPPAREAKMNFIRTPDHVFLGDNALKAEIRNLGTEVITTADFTYTIDGGAAQTATVTGLNIQPFTNEIITAASIWNVTADQSYLVEATVENINGGGADFDQNNNSATKYIGVRYDRVNNMTNYSAVGQTFQYDVIAGSGAQVAAPTDLDFAPDGALWILNFGSENSGGSTVKITNPSEASQTELWQQDANAWHFMSLPTGIAFGANSNFATSAGVYDANHGTGAPFTGPSLWSSDPAIYAQPSGGNGSHIDMLHESPNSMGIEAYYDNAYWVFDDNTKDIVMYDFKADHGPGNDDHSDGELIRYPEFGVSAINHEIPCHMKYDPRTEKLYIVDGGNGRIIKVDVNSGVLGGDPAFGQTEPLALYSVMTGVTYETIVSTGLVEPSGIDVQGNTMVVSDHSNGDLVFYDISGSPATEIGRIITNDPGIQGIVMSPNGELYYVNHNDDEVVKVTPLQALATADLLEEASIEVFPNPTSGQVTVRSAQESGMISVIDLKGSLMKQVAVNSTEVTVDLTDLSKGVYFLKVEGDKGTSVRRIVKR